MHTDLPDRHRHLNEDRRRAFGTRGRMIAFVCECSDPFCLAAVLLSPEAYDARRPGPVLHPAHLATAFAPAAAPPDASVSI
jgi:hypothetical protein